MLLITLVRTLIALETARITAPHCPVVGNAFAEAWLATVQARGGSSQGLARVVYGAALRKFARVSNDSTLEGDNVEIDTTKRAVTYKRRDSGRLG